MLRWMARVSLIAVLLAGLMAAVAPVAMARGVWDPNDVDHRLDIRWVGVRYSGDGMATVTVTFYPGFRARQIPKLNDWSFRNELVVDLDFMEAEFFRKNGRIKVSFGDHGSGCCVIYRAQRPNATTLVVDVEPFDESDPGIEIDATATRHREVDATRTFHTGPPP